MWRDSDPPTASIHTRGENSHYKEGFRHFSPRIRTVIWASVVSRIALRGSKRDRGVWWRSTQSASSNCDLVHRVNTAFNKCRNNPGMNIKEEVACCAYVYSFCVLWAMYFPISEVCTAILFYICERLPSSLLYCLLVFLFHNPPPSTVNCFSGVSRMQDSAAEC